MLRYQLVITICAMMIGTVMVLSGVQHLDSTVAWMGMCVLLVGGMYGYINTN
jgi:hypothetical protein